MNKITEFIVEPSKVYTSSTFLLKVKATRYLTYQEVKDNFTYTTIQQFSYSQLKGE